MLWRYISTRSSVFLIFPDHCFLLLFSVAIDGEDVTQMVVSEITSLISSNAKKERRLTVIRTFASNHGTNSHEEKYDDNE